MRYDGFYGILIDLKIDKDIGQMNMYLGYFANEEHFEGDNPLVGIILTRQKNELLVKFPTYGMSSQLFVSKYQTYLPSEEELRAKLEEILTKSKVLISPTHHLSIFSFSNILP